MFPFSFKANYSFNIPSGTTPLEKLLITSFADQFVDSRIKENTIKFRFFKVLFKRHAWLDEGTTSFSIQDDKLKVDLFLSFAGTTVLYLILSVLFIALHFSQIHVAIILTALLWSINALAYLWTVSTFKSSIKNVVRNHLSNS
ncbi:hypothetical protein JAO76_05180 [Pontibacter sp. BT310]|uniref:Glycosyl-4,4'-diaponeurosporenoate acyltransferase n=1 Tax=Pontibacter populi TaxID=890055 RepID=A0ABS6X8T7_9BACT|nr:MULTISPECIES: hypothetical protein [Pontibacter]MBJ6117570.1 hypothetical protein [Pontibacter sp. BT310]MBR0569995.1 hypothetical protein [Microvirga sp. STS03]MBW3364423.1 hypothetical protein [Pontibacter populi]